MLNQRRFDFPEFYAEATNLNLRILSAQKSEIAAPQESRHASPVLYIRAFWSAAKGINNKAFRV